MHDTLVFWAYAANLFVQAADSFLTNAGLSAKMVEGNPVTHWMMSKIGQAGTDFIKIGLIPVLPMIIFKASHQQIATGFNFLMAGVTVPVVVRNFIMLRNQKISIFG